MTTNEHDCSDGYESEADAEGSANSEMSALMNILRDEGRLIIGHIGADPPAFEGAGVVPWTIRPALPPKQLSVKRFKVKMRRGPGG